MWKHGNTTGTTPGENVNCGSFEKLVTAMLRSALSYYNYEFPMDGIHVSGGLMTLLNVQFET